MNNHLQPTNIATAFYLRIQEALAIPAPTTALRNIRAVLEQLFLQLTSQEPRSFSNLFARMEFCFDKLELPDEWQEALTALRIITGKVVADNSSSTQEQCLLAAKTLAEAVGYFYQAPVPDQLADKYALVAHQRLLRPAYQQWPLIPLLKCLVMETGSLQTDSNGKRSSILRCRNDELGEFRLQLRETAQPHFITLSSLLRPYDTVHIMQCRKTEQEQLYTTVSETRVILEPDLLIDISDLAECFSARGAYPLLYLVKKLVPQQYGNAVLKGNLVNALLDALLRDKQLPLKTSFVAAVAENGLQACVYGKETLNNMFSNIREVHWPNLQKAAAALQDQPLRIEPAFYAAQYGLQGRLDILAEDEHDPHRKEIFELKSGRAPDFDTWRNHKMQVVGYNLLLHAAFGPERKGSSAILYSAADSNNYLRHVTSTGQDEQELLALRNEVVAALLRLAAGDCEVLGTITTTAAQGLPSFSIQHFSRFQQAYTAAPPLLKAYYQHFLSFTLREFLLAKCGMYAAPNREEDQDGFAALWLRQEAEKRERFNIIPHLQFQAFHTTQSTAIFRISTAVHHNFRAGDVAIMYPRSAPGVSPLQHQVLKGRIDELQKDTLVFSLNNRQVTPDFFSRYDEWVIEHDFYEANHWMSAAALFQVLEPQHAQRMALLLGLREPKQLPSAAHCPVMFNDNQQQILQAALAAQDYYLVQGPPGTGKTSAMLTALVATLVQRNSPVMVVAFTNRAVDEICRKLSDKGIAHLRLGGRRSAAESRLHELCLNGQLEEAARFITGQQVFVTTVATMTGRIELLRMLGVQPDTLIADEASQLTEPQLLGLLMHFRKFILIGDQNQLPPVVAQQECFCRVNDAGLQESGITDLRCTIFERLMQYCKTRGWQHAWGMLNTHFRMHNDIAGLINHYYAGQLTPGKPEQLHAFVGGHLPAHHAWAQVLSKGRALFIPSPRETTSKMHGTEAARVVSLLHYLKSIHGPGSLQDKVGVVTPWRTQISYIRELIGDDEALQNINIDTVERFQGAENDIIIVSLAVYHPAQLQILQNIGCFRWEEESIAVDRKLLVTLSRARQQVIVMGYEPVLRESIHYANALNEMARCEMEGV